MSFFDHLVDQTYGLFSNKFNYQTEESPAENLDWTTLLMWSHIWQLPLSNSSREEILLTDATVLLMNKPSTPLFRWDSPDMTEILKLFVPPLLQMRFYMNQLLFENPNAAQVVTDEEIRQMLVKAYNEFLDATSKKAIRLAQKLFEKYVVNNADSIAEQVLSLSQQQRSDARISLSRNDIRSSANVTHILVNSKWREFILAAEPAMIISGASEMIRFLRASCAYNMLNGEPLTMEQFKNDVVSGDVMTLALHLRYATIYEVQAITDTFAKSQLIKDVIFQLPEQQRSGEWFSKVWIPMRQNVRLPPSALKKQSLTLPPVIQADIGKRKRQSELLPEFAIDEQQRSSKRARRESTMVSEVIVEDPKTAEKRYREDTEEQGKSKKQHVITNESTTVTTLQTRPAIQTTTTTSISEPIVEDSKTALKRYREEEQQQQQESKRQLVADELIKEEEQEQQHFMCLTCRNEDLQNAIRLRCLNCNAINACDTLRGLSKNENCIYQFILSKSPQLQCINPYCKPQGQPKSIDFYFEAIQGSAADRLLQSKEANSRYYSPLYKQVLNIRAFEKATKDDSDAPIRSDVAKPWLQINRLILRTMIPSTKQIVTKEILLNQNDQSLNLVQIFQRETQGDPLFSRAPGSKIRLLRIYKEPAATFLPDKEPSFVSQIEQDVLKTPFNLPLNSLPRSAHSFYPPNTVVLNFVA